MNLFDLTLFRHLKEELARVTPEQAVSVVNLVDERTDGIVEVGRMSESLRGLLFLSRQAAVLANEAMRAQANSDRYSYEVGQAVDLLQGRSKFLSVAFKQALQEEFPIIPASAEVYCGPAPDFMLYYVPAHAARLEQFLFSDA
ncbi:MAG TPA: hypothetical protein PKD95_02380 [Candidatus Paceibacterota bacterium]|nr:hypothetical protein [Candidatus Paceibacterota bacterium]